MKTQHDRLMQDSEFSRLFAVESAVTEAAGVIARLMEEQRVSKAELARRMGRSRAWVTQLLSGSANMTVRTLGEVTFHLGSTVRFLSSDTRSGLWSSEASYVSLVTSTSRGKSTIKAVDKSTIEGEGGTGYAA